MSLKKLKKILNVFPFIYYKLSFFCEKKKQTNKLHLLWVAGRNAHAICECSYLCTHNVQEPEHNSRSRCTFCSFLALQ